MIRPLSLFALCAGLSACAADSRADLNREVSELAKAGMPFAEAQANLQRAGFQCRRQGFEEATLCNRERSHRLLATCVQNVYLTLSDEGDAVGKLEVPNPSCTGF